MYRLAGGLAEQKISKKSHMSVFGLGPAESDWREFLRLGVDVASGHRLAVEFVRRRWAGITAVAMVLARDGTLSPDAVHRILAQEGGAR